MIMRDAQNTAFFVGDDQKSCTTEDGHATAQEHFARP